MPSSRTPPTPDPAGPVDPALAAGFDRAWSLLACAVDDRGSGLRLPVVASVHRGDPDARVMVLRAVDRATRSLKLYSDLRAPKVADLAGARTAMIGYDHAARFQLRLLGVAAVATAGAAVDSAWAALDAKSRLAYRSIDPPGTAVAVPPLVPDDAVDEGRANFAVVTIVLDSVEWLDLSVAGHRRARFRRDESRWSGSWLVP